MERSFKEIKKGYIQRMKDEELEKIKKNQDSIQAFIELCHPSGIILTEKDFGYGHCTGLCVTYPDIVKSIFPEIIIDKEGLVLDDILENNYEKDGLYGGYLYGSEYTLMAHSYFRRGFHEMSCFAPLFIDLYWRYNHPKVTKSVALDYNRIRIDNERSVVLELDTWYGAKFDKEISNISDGSVKLVPPIELNDFDLLELCGNVYSLDIIWKTKGNIKSFQAKEFKKENEVITVNGENYHPAKYIHAEYDINLGHFRHFDGAIHLYSSDDYYARRDSDFNYNQKNSNQIKGQSIKLFKLNGAINVKTWTHFTSHFFTGNPLIFEYFEGKLPEHIQRIVDSCIND